MEKRLVRSPDKVVAGVCSGLANYFGVDTTLVRLIFVLAFLFASAGLFVYLILWFIMPQA